MNSSKKAEKTAQTIRILQLDRPLQKPIDNGFRFAASYWPWALIALWAILYLPMLDDRPLRFEEGKRAAQASAIYFKGDWWHLDVFGRPYVAKPPLLPWTIALFAFIRGGVDEIAIRIGPVLSVLIGALTAAVTARSVAPNTESRMAAFLSGLAFLCSAFILLKGRIGETDVMSTAFAGSAMALWVAMRLRGPVSIVGWLGVGVLLALVNLTKGPIPLLFPLIPIAAVTLLARRRGEIAGMLAALAIAFVPLVIWLMFNREYLSVAELGQETRLTNGISLEYLISLLHLGYVPNVIVRLMPWILPVAVWLWRGHKINDPRKREIIRALLIFILPYAVLILIWPGSRGRYVMPISWPVAVMCGIALSHYWSRNRMAGTVACLGLGFALVFQAINFLAIDGKTEDQVARRALATALYKATRDAKGPILLAIPAGGVNYNVFAYTSHPILRIRAAAINCPSESNLMIAEGTEVARARASQLWRERVAFVDQDFAVFVRSDIPPGPGCEKSM